MTDLIIPNWPAPANVKAFFTTRNGGVSEGAYASLNLGRAAGDTLNAVKENRRRFEKLLPQPPAWLSQVHGTRVIEAAAVIASGAVEAADAAYTRAVGSPCAVMVADCLPVLFCDDEGQVVAAAHAGWRGLAAGMLECTVEVMQTPPAKLMAWLGPAIGPSRFEVGEDVLQAFVAVDPNAARAFVPRGAAHPGKYFADLFALAHMRLARAGLTRVYGGGVCTMSDPARFFSYRRDGASGRMAGVIWRTEL